jgi:hypothetical protein
MLLIKKLQATQPDPGKINLLPMEKAGIVKEITEASNAY